MATAPAAIQLAATAAASAAATASARPAAARRRKSEAAEAAEAVSAPAPGDGLPDEGSGNDKGADGNEASEQVFDVELPDDLFEAGPNAEVVFADSHDDQIVYGRFFLRQVGGLCAQVLAQSLLAHSVC